jgi:lipopolysaccharide biosynthesis glycosyltransferase
MRGIVYIGLGQKYLEMSISSAISVRKQTKAVPPIIIFTDLDIKAESSENISIQKIDSRYRTEFSKISTNFNPAYEGTYLKTRLFDLSPFEETLYLDSDILALKDINGIWDYLGKDIDIAIAPAFAPLTSTRTSLEAIETFNRLTDFGDYSQYNAGVVLFSKTERTLDFFKCWTKEWGVFKESDNMALTRALCIDNPTISKLPARYNEFYPWMNRHTILLHYVDIYKYYLD